MWTDRAKSLLSGTALYHPARVAYAVMLRLYDEAKRPYYWIEDTYYTYRYESDGFHRITVGNDRVESFWLSLPSHSRSRRVRMRGQWEPEVMDALVTAVDANSTYWEVGAAWGYFAMALAPLVDTVYAFEARENLVTEVENAIEKNGYENVHPVTGIVGKNVDLTEYPPPDVLLMHVEGFEYEILSQNDWLLMTDTTFIIELHPSAQSVPEDTDPTVDPEGVLRLLSEHGYAITKLDDGKFYHVLAEPK